MCEPQQRIDALHERNRKIVLWSLLIAACVPLACGGGDRFEGAAPIVTGDARFDLDAGEERFQLDARSDRNPGTSTGGAVGNDGGAGTGGSAGEAFDAAGEDGESPDALTLDTAPPDPDAPEPDGGSDAGNDAADDTEPDRDAASAADGAAEAEADGGPDAACAAEQVVFRDEDGDGAGDESNATATCSDVPEGWASTGGDCNDRNAEVVPEQTSYFGAGYPAGGNALSFDYDCSGTETADPSQYGAAKTCPGLNLGACSGKGFAPTTRTGAGVNPYCGSTALVECRPQGLSCVSVVIQTAAKRCR
jgi:hypothetical protein